MIHLKVCSWALVQRILIYNLSLLLEGQPRGKYNKILEVDFPTRRYISPWPPPVVVPSEIEPRKLMLLIITQI